MNAKHNSILFALIILTLFSCVPARKYEELKAKQETCRNELSKQKTLNKELNEENQELKSSLDELKKKKATLEHDLEMLQKSYEQTKTNYDNVNDTYQLLLDKNKELLAGNKSSTEKLMNRLQKAQIELQTQEDALRTLETSLLKKESELAKLSADLKAREQRVNELEAIINKKDEALTNLKKKVKDALLGFENNGLTIEQKNGKVYVSLDESLLFASGKYTVGTKGTDVLKKLAKALETSSDIDIVVEGHTDNVPLNGKGIISDNWDLSVKRATSVVKILTKNSNINPKRLTAAGRGEFSPLDIENTAEGRKKNRRIEVILTPKLDELFELLDAE